MPFRAAEHRTEAVRLDVHMAGGSVFAVHRAFLHRRLSLFPRMKLRDILEVFWFLFVLALPILVAIGIIVFALGNTP
jgi:hypothetical protein